MLYVNYILIDLEKKNTFPVFYQSGEEAVKVLWSGEEKLELLIVS